MSSTSWMLTNKMVDKFLQLLKLEHLRFMDKAGNEKPTVDPDTLIDYNTFCTAYNKMDKDFQSKCPRTFFAFSNDGLMKAKYDELKDNLLQFVHTFEDYYELCYCGGEFSEKVDFSILLGLIKQNCLEKHHERQNMSAREFKSWVELVNDHVRFLLNPFNQKEIFVSAVIESEILSTLRGAEVIPWFSYKTLKKFEKRFQDATNQSKHSKGFLVREDFYDLNVLDDEDEQPFTCEFVDRLFVTLASKQKLKKVADYRMDFRTFVQVRRMFFHPKSVATRRFLFELIDLDGDGFIGVNEVRHFYDGLSSAYTKAGLDVEHPFVSFKNFFDSWYDQMTPSRNHRERKLSFEQIRNHAYGHECLMMLVNSESCVDFDRRFEANSGCDPADDTVLEDVEILYVDVESDENSNEKSAESKNRKQSLHVSI